MQSLADLGEAFDSAFSFLGENGGPPVSTLLQVSSEMSESSSSSSSDDENVMLRDDETGDVIADVTMEGSSNNKDSGKLSGFSPEDAKINMMFDTYTGADNDEFMHEVLEDYATKDKPTSANPSGVVLTKFNGERATRRFVQTAHKIDGKNLDKFMEQEFPKAWDKYDVNKEGQIDSTLVPTYFRSLLGDFTAQFNLREEDRFLH